MYFYIHPQCFPIFNKIHPINNKNKIFKSKRTQQFYTILIIWKK